MTAFTVACLACAATDSGAGRHPPARPPGACWVTIRPATAELQAKAGVTN